MTWLEEKFKPRKIIHVYQYTKFRSTAALQEGSATLESCSCTFYDQYLHATMLDRFDNRFEKYYTETKQFAYWKEQC